MAKKSDIKKLIKIMAKEMAQEICDYQADDYKTILDENVERYYNDFMPKFYNRKYSLYNAYKVKNTGKSVDIYFGPEFLGNLHKVGDEYIYKWMYEGGWHGGAHNTKGIRIKNPHDPLGERVFASMLYRTPHPLMTKEGEQPFRKWSQFPVAFTAPSPYYGALEDLDKYDETFLHDRIEQAIDDVLGKYGII